jgi:PAS domain S-box-containing protein
LWIGTRSGVARYQQGVVYAVPGLANGLDVRALEIGPDGLVWAGTDEGVWTGDAQGLTRLVGPDPQSAVNAILSDSQGNVWLATDGGGLIRVTPTGYDSYAIGDLYPNASIQALVETAEGEIWIGTDHGIAILGNGLLRPFGNRGLPDEAIRALLAAENGDIWIGTDFGVARWSGSSISELIAAELSKVPVWAIAEDHEGGIHFGTSGRGLVSYSPSAFTQVSAEAFGLRTVWSIAQDELGQTWFGLEGGLMKLERDGLVDLSRIAGLERSSVRFIHPDASGRLVVGTRDGVSRLSPDGALTPVPTLAGSPVQEVRSIAHTASGSLVVATNESGAFIEKGGVLQPFLRGTAVGDELYDVFVDSRDRMWFAGAEGLTILAGDRLMAHDRSTGLPDEFILGVAEDSYGTVWVGTHGGGLAMTNVEGSLKAPTWDTLSVQDGLSDAVVLFMEFDGEGALWVGTNNGLNRIDVQAYNRTGEKSVEVFGPSEGYSGIESNLHAAWRDDRGHMWFGNIAGVSVLDPFAQPLGSDQARAQITNVRVHFEPRDWEGDRNALGLPTQALLASNEGHVTFDFVGMTYRASERVTHRHRLLGFDDEWSPPTAARSATYSNLPAGEYTFEVQASTNGKDWESDTARQHISIATPYWATVWFRLLALAGIGLAVYLVIWLRTRSMEAQRQRLVDKVNDRTRALQKEVFARQETMEALAASEEQFRYLVENVSDVIFSVTPEGKITYISPAIEPIVGIRAEDLIGECLGELFRGTGENPVDRCMEMLGSGEATVGEYRLGGGLSQQAWLRVSEKATIVDGKITAIQGVLTDITHQKELELRLAQASKLESIGQLAAGIAHEINTPVQFVGANTTFLKECLEDIEELGEHFRTLRTARKEVDADALAQAVSDIEAFVLEIELEQLLHDMPLAIEESLDGISRIGEIVSAMKDFSHPGTKAKSPADLEQVARSSAAVSRNSWKEHADMIFEFADDLPMVPVVASEISQVLLNMFVNSAHAIEGQPERGTITVRGRVANGRCELDVEDTGGGMPQEVVDRIFDPFFTTKEVGKGTGQGLSITHDVIVKRHGGTLEVVSQPGHGTRFTIGLPLKDVVAAA